ncbi:hypothetical protein ACTXT7_001482 [Hymenolepis weldensis]
MPISYVKSQNILNIKLLFQEGIGGAFFYAISSCVAVTMMAPLSVELKIKAPGARTFLQVIRTRFGTTVHIVYCVCAITINLGMMLEVCSSKLHKHLKSHLRLLCGEDSQKDFLLEL